MDEKTEIILTNEKEWRKVIWSELVEIRKRVNFLNVRIATIGATSAIIVSVVAHLITRG